MSSSCRGLVGCNGVGRKRRIADADAAEERAAASSNTGIASSSNDAGPMEPQPRSRKERIAQADALDAAGSRDESVSEITSYFRRLTRDWAKGT